MQWVSRWGGDVLKSPFAATQKKHGDCANSAQEESQRAARGLLLAQGSVTQFCGLALPVKVAPSSSCPQEGENLGNCLIL